MNQVVCGEFSNEQTELNNHPELQGAADEQNQMKSVFDLWRHCFMLKNTNINRYIHDEEDLIIQRISFTVPLSRDL